MKYRKITIVVLIIATAIFNFSSAKNTNQMLHFNANGANDWVFVLKNKNLKAADLFQLGDGYLKITDATSGYIRTRNQYKNFTLSVDWRWTTSFGNSGALIYIQPNDTVWPVCYQVQQKADAAGDIICMNGLWAKECKDSVKMTIPKLKVSNEKPLGEWNNMLVKCNGAEIKVYINGELQNKVTGLTVNNGFIGFQAEGKAMEFRNLTIR